MRIAASARSALLALLLAAPVAACGSRSGEPTAPAVVARGVSAQPSNGAIRLTNNTDGPIVYAAIELDAYTLMLASWGPCPRLAECTVEPGQTAVIPYAAISMYQPGARKAVVVWWRVVSRDPEYELIADPVEFFVEL